MGFICFLLQNVCLENNKCQGQNIDITKYKYIKHTLILIIIKPVIYHYYYYLLQTTPYFEKLLLDSKSKPLEFVFLLFVLKIYRP